MKPTPKRAADEIAAELIGRRHLSYSSMSLYRQCPLRFYFRYVRGLPEESVAAGLVFGGAIHRTVEFHYRELMAGYASPDSETLLSVYRDEWRQRESDAIRFSEREDAATLEQLADRMLRAFQSGVLAQPEGQILAVEEELRGPFADGCPDILARIDLLTETDDAVVITDLKTSRSRWNHDQLEDAGEQLLLYHDLVHELFPHKPVRLQFAVLTKTKVPAADLLPVEVSPQRLERARRVVQRVWQSIEGQAFFPRPSPMNCPGCPYREACRQWPDV